MQNILDAYADAPFHEIHDALCAGDTSVLDKYVDKYKELAKDLPPLPPHFPPDRKKDEECVRELGRFDLGYKIEDIENRFSRIACLSPSIVVTEEEDIVTVAFQAKDAVSGELIALSAKFKFNIEEYLSEEMVGFFHRIPPIVGLDEDDPLLEIKQVIEEQANRLRTEWDKGFGKERLLQYANLSPKVNRLKQLTDSTISPEWDRFPDCVKDAIVSAIASY